MAARVFPDPDGAFKRRLLHWAARQPYCVLLDSCGTDIDRYGRYEYLLGVGLLADAPLLQDLDALGRAMAEGVDWLFGFLGYELKGDLEPTLRDDLKPVVPFPKMGLFRADVVVAKHRGSADVSFECGYSDELWQAIAGTHPADGPGIVGRGAFESNFTPERYAAAVDALRAHIRAGDAYEINLSQNLTAALRMDAPAALWEQLVKASPVPFAGYLRWQGLHLLCASPERFLQHRGGRLLTQPIKGTAPRDADPERDRALAEALHASPKERAENVMIVDLSRNDLHRSCEVGSVEVPHLFEVQHFPQVHHLVSSITGTLRSDLAPVDALRHAFPPGSMTGAPKVRTCQLIRQYEQRARGIYAGSLGYVAPGGDFDFNVVIRSMAYDHGRGLLSYHVGGAVTWDSDPAAEYAETLLKAKAIMGLFSGD